MFPIKKINNIINIDKSMVLLFDLDGTLVDTDYANFLAYKEAIDLVINISAKICFDKNKRFTRNFLKKVIPNLTQEDYKKIVKEKEKVYEKYLNKTKVKEIVYDILVRYHKTNKTFLVTNSKKKRALVVLNYYGLTNKFSHLFYLPKGRSNKYDCLISNYNIPVKKIIIFENDDKEIDNAICAGILAKNIFKV